MRGCTVQPEGQVDILNPLTTTNPLEFSATELAAFLSHAGFNDATVEACTNAGIDGPCLTTIVELNDMDCLIDLLPRVHAYRLRGHWKIMMKRAEQQEQVASNKIILKVGASELVVFPL